MKIHVTGLPHTAPTRAFDWCAYTAKVRRWATMLGGLGYDVTIYGGVPAPDCQLKYVPATMVANAADWWPEWDDSKVWPGWDASAPWWKLTNDRIASAIANNFETGDVVAITAGRAQQPIADHLAWACGAHNMTVIEWAVGYSGTFTDRRVFESYAWRHHVQGLIGGASGQWVVMGNLYDTVIPNFFLPDEYEDGGGLDDYLLYIGRRTQEKGCEIVNEIAKHHRVLIAGQGGYPIPNADEDLGVILGEEKRHLFANARGVIVPTLYIEPFGGVAVEAMLNGTPVITTDFGAFTETVLDGVTGLRCASLADFLEAAEHIGGLDRVATRQWARARFTAEAVVPAWEAWLEYVTDYTAGRFWYDTKGGIK